MRVPVGPSGQARMASEISTATPLMRMKLLKTIAPSSMKKSAAEVLAAS